MKGGGKVANCIRQNNNAIASNSDLCNSILSLQLAG